MPLSFSTLELIDPNSLQWPLLYRMSISKGYVRNILKTQSVSNLRGHTKFFSAWRMLRRGAKCKIQPTEKPRMDKTRLHFICQKQFRAITITQSPLTVFTFPLMWALKSHPSMNELKTQKILCAYCGEKISVLLDCSVEHQQYIEDCQVCCRPITFDVSIGPDNDITVAVSHENE